MRNTRGSTLRPLAAALAFALAPMTTHAVTTLLPGELEGQGVESREDGTPIRTALRAWHLDALAHPAPAAPPASTVRIVTSCGDDGAGSLRATIAASASGDTIDLSQLACSAITLTTGAIAVRLESAKIVGPLDHELAIDGHAYDRVFVHFGSGSFTLRNLVVRNGHYRATRFHVAIGGCIASAGYLTLEHSTVTGCYAGGEGSYGGAIYAYSLLMGQSTLSNNVAYGAHLDADTAAFGGAAFVYQIDMVGSTITGNRAHHKFNPTRSNYDIGGGISTVRGGLVIDSTIDSNYAYGRGGGLATLSDIVVRNSTISGNQTVKTGGGGLFIRYAARLDAASSTVTDNTGPDGSGILFTSWNASLASTIVAGNHGAPDIAAQRTLSVDGSHNLIGAATSVVAMPPDTLESDPGLQPLAYNGGPTRTHALRLDSAALDAGDNASGLPSDQRGPGFARVVGPAADIGAFELNASAGDGVARLPVPALSTTMTTFLLASLGLVGALVSRRRSARRG